MFHLYLGERLAVSEVRCAMVSKPKLAYGIQRAMGIPARVNASAGRVLGAARPVPGVTAGR